MPRNSNILVEPSVCPRCRSENTEFSDSYMEDYFYGEQLYCSNCDDFYWNIYELVFTHQEAD